MELFAAPSFHLCSKAFGPFQMVHIEEIFDDDDLVIGPGESLKAATADKSLGNKYFKEGDNVGAIKQYTEAIHRLEPHAQHPGVPHPLSMERLIQALASSSPPPLDNLSRNLPYSYGYSLESSSAVPHKQRGPMHPHWPNGTTELGSCPRDGHTCAI